MEVSDSDENELLIKKKTVSIKEFLQPFHNKLDEATTDTFS